jgi:hypothetical protein
MDSRAMRLNGYGIASAGVTLRKLQNSEQLVSSPETSVAAVLSLKATPLFQSNEKPFKSLTKL